MSRSAPRQHLLGDVASVLAGATATSTWKVPVSGRIVDLTAYMTTADADTTYSLTIQEVMVGDKGITVPAESGSVQSYPGVLAIAFHPYNPRRPTPNYPVRAGDLVQVRYTNQRNATSTIQIALTLEED